jgi:zinc carboxypeptidase
LLREAKWGSTLSLTIEPERLAHVHVNGSGFAELGELERIIEEARAYLEVAVTCEVETGSQRFPVYALALGTTDPQAPAVGFFGGVHGLERIGTRVLLVFLRSLMARLPWDGALQGLLERVRLVFMPLVNPGGMWQSSRSNPRGVDLMRNAPVDARERPTFMVCGQRLSSRLPWYRGRAGAEMEAESQAVCRLVERELLSRPFSIALDCHSGFGAVDRIWFPYACSRAPMDHLAEVDALTDLFQDAYPTHNYVMEPQSRQYVVHGDLWDYLYLRSREMGERIFLPLTLEMGSWLWIRKRPMQLLSWDGAFNPIPFHRLQRVLRRHLIWLEFLVRAAGGHRHWLPAGAERDRHRQAAEARWYCGSRQ